MNLSSCGIGQEHEKAWRNDDDFVGENCNSLTDLNDWQISHLV